MKMIQMKNNKKTVKSMKKINVKSCSLIIIAGLATACSGEYVNKEKENKVLEEK